MGLSRLDNFLKSVRGNTLYVDPNSLDATDSVENQGNSPTRPFKTIQRALIEAARFSYQIGNNNDRFNKTTIILQPGEHIVDNRPGLIVNEVDSNYTTRGGFESYTDFDEFTLLTNFDVLNDNNILYKLNSIHGGVIVPRGTSIVGSDLRKTKIVPRYVPNPENSNIERSAVFRITGGCYFYGFTIFDANPNGTCFKDYTLSQFVPNFSHHKLSCFEYADGVNSVKINDDFLVKEYEKTDLDMYYKKVAIAYGQNSGRQIVEANEDIQSVVDEYRIVGSKGEEATITNITSSGTTVTVTIAEELSELSANSPIQISGVQSSESEDVYNGQFIISSVISSTQFTYTTTVVNVDTTPNVASATLNFSVDTVTSASPYIYNISLRSVYGMCGMLADGSKAGGFKSMVVAQFTGIGLQKDDNAFVKYNTSTGTYQYSNQIVDLHTNSRSRFRPEYRNFHIKATNNAFIQLVSIFAIGYAEQFVAESGGDLSITNSNSNFGAQSLVSRGFRDESFPRDDVGYITHIVSPQEISKEKTSVEFFAIDVGISTQIGAATTTRLYLYNQTNEDFPPSSVVDGYRIGAKTNDILYAQISQSGITSTYSCRITMPGSNLSREKSYHVNRIGSTNSINTGTGEITLTEPHEILLGEKVRIFSQNGNLPDGLEDNKIYYATGITSTTLKLATTLSDALVNTSDISIKPNNNGGILQIRSRVSDKNEGDIGHPIQYDPSLGNWYVNVSSTDNTLYDIINNVGISGLGKATPRTYVERIVDTRNLVDSIYKLRYVIPKDSNTSGRSPLDGFIIQSSSSTGLLDSEQDFYYNLESFTDLFDNSSQLRNPCYIANADWSSNTATIYTEIPHDISVNSEVKIQNVTSGLNTTTNQEKGFNGVFTVTSVPSSKQFTYSLNDDPGSFQNDTTIRDANLPRFSIQSLPITYQTYRVIEQQPYIENKQDGIYQLFVINNSNSPSVSPFTNSKFSQPVQYLYPQSNRDNPTSDPSISSSFAAANPIGKVSINDPELSITKETIQKISNDLKLGFGVTSIISSSGTAHTIFTDVEHGLSGITSVSILSSGSNYIDGDYFAANLVGFAGSITGSGANARISVSGGSISSLVIMDPGSVYGIGNTLQVIPAAGIGTTTGFTPAVIQVEKIIDNIGDTIEISGLIGTTFAGYNNLYKVVGLTTISNEIRVSSASSVSGFSTTQLSLDQNLASYTGKLLSVSAVTYNNETGIGIVTFTDSHGLNINNSVLFSGFDEDFFNTTAHLTNKLSLVSGEFNFGKNNTLLPTSGTIEAYVRGYSSRGGNLSKEDENISGRNIIAYGGIQSKLITQLTSDSGEADELEIANAYESGFRRGDYLQIDREIFRISGTVLPTTDTVNIFRSLLGSPRQTHDANSVVKKIKITPIEFRRNSIIRASGQTFEYLGYGSGNYSTAFPERQDRVLSPQEELNAQASRENGGIVIFTAMNSDGDFYTGNKKVNSSTGKEEVFDTPIPTVTGEELDTGVFNVGFDIISPLEISISRSLRVEGGSNSNIISEFDGPVVFNNKLTSTSDKGIEASSLYLQGDADVSRNLTVGISTPTLAGNYGDVVTRTEPFEGSNLGWVYTTENEWKQWGWIGNLGDPLYGVGISSAGGSVGFSTLVDFVGIGVTVTVGFNTLTNTSTVTVSGDPTNTISISSDGTFIGDSSALDFVGEKDGFGFKIDVDYGGVLGITTIRFDVPLDVINFKTFAESGLGYANPAFASTSVGTRIIYEETLNGISQTNFACGIGPAIDSLWWSIPDTGSSFDWFGGETLLGKLTGVGELYLYEASTLNSNYVNTTIQVAITTTTTAPISVASTVQVDNLNVQYLNGFVSSATTTPNTIVVRDGSGNMFGNSTRLLHNVSGGQPGEWYTDIPARQGYVSFNKAGDLSTGICTFTQVSDIYKNRTGSTLSCNFTEGPITRTTSTTVNIINITNVPTTDERALNYTVVMNASTTVADLSNIDFRINGTSLSSGGNSIRWLNNLPPEGTAAGYYFFGFTIFRVGSVWEVIAVFATYA